MNFLPFAKTIGSKASGGIMWWFKLGLMGVVVSFLLINAVMIAYESKDIRPAINDLGDRFFNPLLNIQEEGNKVINDELNNEQTFLDDKLILYWSLLVNFYMLYIWLKIIYFIISFFLGENLPGFIRLIVTIIFFMMIIVTKLALQGKEINTPFYVIRDIFKILFSAIKGFR